MAESACGGLISASLLAVPGASAYFLGGTVVYTYKSRKAILGISKAQVESLEPMTQAMARAFAARAKDQLGATWGLSELGIAGPGPAVYGFAPGTCVVGVSGPIDLGGGLQTGSDDRQANMWAFADKALATLEAAIQQA